MDRLLRGFEVDPRVGGQHEADLAAPHQRLRADGPPQPGHHGAQGSIGVGRGLVRPERVDELVTASMPVPVEHQVGEQQAALATRDQVGDAATPDLHREPAADLNSGRGLTRQGWCKENVRTDRSVASMVRDASEKRGAMAKQIICQCGYVGRGETAEDVAHVIEKHMQSDHPELVGEVTFEDLLAMAEEA
jgi:hypothetical protein